MTDTIRAEIRWDVAPHERPLLVMAWDDVPWGDQRVCTVPSCRWRGLNHDGHCRSINGAVPFGDDRGQRRQMRPLP